MVLMMTCKIVFPATQKRDKIELTTVQSVEIESSWQKLTDTAQITLPRSLYFDSDKLLNQFSVGDRVEIYLGYDGENKLEFSGSITKISTDSPFTLQLQDRMWLLKQITVNKVWSKINLKQLVREIVPVEIPIDVADIELGGISAKKITVAKLLQQLKDKFKIYSYFRNDKLIVGKVYTANIDAEIVRYVIEENVIRNDLQFRTKDDYKLKITAVSFTKDHKQLRVSVGEDGGIEKEIPFYNIISETELKKLAQQRYELEKQDGYTGSIQTFGIPYVQHGYKAEIISRQYPERNGIYWIDSVQTVFSENGFRRTVKIGKKAEL